MTVRYHTQQYVRTFEIDGWLDAYDTNWVINQCCNPKTCSWPVFFPIIDTTGMGLDGFQWAEGYGCTTVQTFHLLYVEGQKAYLSWSANSDALFYEVSYGLADIVGNSPELGTKLRLNTSMVCLDSLEPGRRYVAFVRAHCAENAKSLWTEGEAFQALASGNIIEDSPASRFTAVMPNPTSSQASVVCSFSINKIEIYTATGQLVKTVKVSANTASLNLSDLPAGTYILRIQTSAGDVAKKLQKL
ncbi:MAG: T9SS type A sorting domain-containing protein [Bacteroidales bacterium]|nr:T9SS type A sorting domain-containing protein [Bacteroidales bacterium]